MLRSPFMKPLLFCSVALTSTLHLQNGIPTFLILELQTLTITTSNRQVLQKQVLRNEHLHFKYVIHKEQFLSDFQRTELKNHTLSTKKFLPKVYNKRQNHSACPKHALSTQRKTSIVCKKTKYQDISLKQMFNHIIFDWASPLPHEIWASGFMPLPLHSYQYYSNHEDKNRRKYQNWCTLDRIEIFQCSSQWYSTNDLTLHPKPYCRMQSIASA